MFTPGSLLSPDTALSIADVASVNADWISLRISEKVELRKELNSLEIQRECPLSAQALCCANHRVLSGFNAQIESAADNKVRKA